MALAAEHVFSLLSKFSDSNFVSVLENMNLSLLSGYSLFVGLYVCAAVVKLLSRTWYTFCLKAWVVFCSNHTSILVLLPAYE